MSRQACCEAADQIEQLGAALDELIACKDLIDSVPELLTEIHGHPIHGRNYAEYQRRKPRAWEVARRLRGKP